MTKKQLIPVTFIFLVLPESRIKKDICLVFLDYQALLYLASSRLLQLRPYNNQRASQQSSEIFQTKLRSLDSLGWRTDA
jgi:hypothetical protein